MEEEDRTTRRLMRAEARLEEIWAETSNESWTEPDDETGAEPDDETWLTEIPF
jgi:hypothetical protein